MHAEFVLIIITLALSAFFSGAEVAIVATSKVKAEQLVSAKRRNARTLLLLKNMPNESLITILIGNNITNVASSALATKISFEIFQSTSIALVTGVMTLVILTFGEIIPKTFVVNNSKRIALSIAPVVLVLFYLFYPLVKAFAFLSKALNNVLGKKTKDPLVTEREIRYLLSVGAKEGQINVNEKSIIDRVFMLNDVPVKKIMTPASEIFSLDWDLTVEKATPLIIEAGFTRLPVFSQKKENIKGMLTIQDVVGQIYVGNNDVKLKDVMNPVYFVNHNKKLDETLKALQIKNYHLAIVLDNKKKVLGLVTVEDILEELVGEIFDEEDKIDFLIRRVSDDEWLVRGKTFIRTINKKLNVALPLSEEFTPLSLFLSAKLKAIKKGSTYTDLEAGLVMVVEQCSGNNVKLVRVKKFS